MSETIYAVKHGVYMKAFSTELYTLSIVNSMAVIQNKETRKVAFVLSPDYYDYLEVCEDDPTDG